MPHLRFERRRLRSTRGVSTLEVVIALSVFLVVALGLASASVRLASQAARNEARLAAVDAIDTRLEVLAGVPFDELLAGTFTAPDACGASGTAEGRASCVRVAGRDIRISYTVGVGTDPVAGVGASAAYVELAAKAALPDGSTVQRNRRVPAPSIGWTSDGAVVRVRAVDEAANLPPITLLDADGNVVVESVPFVAGSAVVRVPGDACDSTNGPCRIALSADPGAWWTTAGWTLSPATINGTASELTLEPGTLLETSVDVAPVATARIRVLAQPAGKGPVGGAPEGTVCVWASFNDGAAARTVPYCNTGAGSEGGNYIPIGSWPSADESTSYHFPAGFTVSVTADRPDGTCPAGPLWGAGSAKGAAPGNTFVDADVCTTWTWGHPTLGGLTGDAPAALGPGGLEVRLEEAGSTYDLIWAGRDGDGDPVGLPAAGDGTTPPWSKPRAAAAAGTCATDGNPATVCSTPPAVPEAEPGAPPECATDPFCLSPWNQPPRLTNPGRPYTIPVTDPDENRFKIGVDDADSATWQFRVTSLPAEGTLTDWAGTPITAGAWLGHSSTYDLRYVRGPGFDGLDTMTVEIVDDDGLSTVVEIGLYSTPEPWTITGPDRITIAQGETNHPVRVRVVATTGENVVGLVPAAAGDDLVAPAPAPTDAGGYTTLNLSAGAIPAGPRTLVVTAGERALAIPVDVVPTPTNLTITELHGGPQGGTGSVTVTATDAVGAPYSGGAITLGVTRDGTTTGRVRPAAGRCVADPSGVCTTSLRIDRAARSGTYTLSASAGAAVATGNLTVTQVPSNLTAAGGRGGDGRFAASTSAANPAAWFHLDERSGSTASSATGGPDGTYHGSPGLGDPPLVAGGDTGAVTFDGLDDRMCAPSVSVGTEGTLEVWANFRGFTNNPADPAQVWGRADDGTSAFAIVLGGGSAGADTPRVIARIGGNLVTATSQIPLWPGRTYHLAATYDGSALRLYVDGVAVAVQQASGPLSADGTWCAGGASVSAEHVAATLDEPAAYPYAMGSSSVGARATLGRVTGSGGGWVTLPQGGSVEVPVSVLDAAGDPIAGQSVAISVDSDRLSSSSPSVTTGAGGTTTFTISAAADSPAGVATGERVVVSAAGTAVALHVEVTPVPSSISVGDVTVAAGGRVTWPVTVLDAAGGPIPGWSVAATTIDGGDGLRLSGRATTDGSGQAQLSVGAAPSASGSQHTVRFTAAGAAAEATVTVTAAVSKLETVNGPFRLAQGSTGTWTVRVTDINGDPLAGAPLTVGCAGCGLSFEAATTDSAGVAGIAVTDIDGPNPEGVYDVVVSIAGDARPARVAVRAAAATIEAGAPVTVTSGGSGSASVVVVDASGNAVPGVPVTGTGPAGITVDGSRTDGRGRAVLTIRATGSVPSGPHTVTVTADGVTAELTVEVAS